MAYINRKDHNGVKPLLQEGELGYDAYIDGGDSGRIYVGTGNENIAQAKKAEVDALDVRVSTAESKLAGIEEGATADQTKADIDALGIDAATVNGLTVETAVPAGAVFTDTVYDDSTLDARVSAIEDNTTLAEYGITDAYTKDEVEALLDAQDQATELVYDNTTSGLTATTVQGAIDEVENRLDTAESRVSTVEGKLAGIEDNAKDDQVASEVPVTAIGNLTSTDVQSGLEELQGDVDSLDTRATAVESKVDDVRTLLGTTSKVRYDKILSSLDVIDMVYTAGDLTAVRYAGDDDATVYYRDVLNYTSGSLTSVQHYYGTADLVTASGTTTLTYDVDGNLDTAVYSE